MLCGETESCARARARGRHRDARLAAGHQPELLRLVHDLLEREVEQRRDLVLDDAAAAGQGRAGREAREHLLGDRHVEDAVGAELVEEALRDAAQRRADVLADARTRRVAQPSRRAAPCRAPGGSASGSRSHSAPWSRPARVDEVERVGRVGVRARAGERDRLVEQRLDLGVDPLALGRIEPARRTSSGSRSRQRSISSSVR